MSAATDDRRLLLRTASAEWTRLRTVRAPWLLLAAAAVVLCGPALLIGRESADGGGGPPDGFAVPEVLTLPGQLALLALVAVAVTADESTGGIVPTLQWTPRRTALLAARVAVPVAAVVAAGTVLAVLSASVATAAASGALALGDGAGVLGRIALVLACGGLLTAGLGLLLRSTAGTLVTVLGLVLVLPLIVGNLGYDWSSDLATVLPGSGTVHLLTGEVPGMTTTSAVVVLVGWAVGAVLLGGLRLVRSDAGR